MQYTFELIISIAISLGIMLAYLEISQETELVYVSTCCQYQFREVPKSDDIAYLCSKCSKWCEIAEATNAK